jgi:hypothetical protein
MHATRTLLAALATLTITGCAAVPLPSIALLTGPGPVQVVGAALGGVIEHDLAAANAVVCPESRREDGLPFDVGPIFLPLGSLGEVVPAEALALVTITPVDVSAETDGLDEASGYVQVTGRLDLAYDLAATRDYAVRVTGGTDPGLVDRVMRVVGDGHLSVSINALVTVARQDGVWLICGDEGLGVGG